MFLCNAVQRTEVTNSTIFLNKQRFL